MAAQRWLACPDCDLLHRVAPLPEGAFAPCRRCRGVLRKRRHRSLERTLALTLGAAVLFAVANTFPFLSFDMKGLHARWVVAGPDGQALVVEESRVEQPVASASWADYVAAQSTALGVPTRRIAERIAALEGS